MNLIKRRYIVLFVVIIILVISLVSINFLFKEEPDIKTEYISYVETTTADNSRYFYVDLKGAVKKPGVYKVKEGTIVNDLINLAGGLKKNAYTDNINLAKTLSSQEVIYISNTNEIKTTTTTQAIVITNEQSSTTKLININTASINELTSLTGIGESKALAIVAYRTQSPFKNIEEIKNVDGIGDSAFAKIKDNITI